MSEQEQFRYSLTWAEDTDQHQGTIVGYGDSLSAAVSALVHLEDSGTVETLIQEALRRDYDYDVEENNAEAD